MNHTISAALSRIARAVTASVDAIHLGLGATQEPAASVVPLIPIDLPVERGDHGWWTNPRVPNFEEDVAAFYAWLEAQHLEYISAMLGDEPQNHQAYQTYFEEKKFTCAAWEPKRPPGDGWFTFSIHDSEDGPVWIWVRRRPA